MHKSTGITSPDNFQNYNIIQKKIGPIFHHEKSTKLSSLNSNALRQALSASLSLSSAESAKWENKKHPNLKIANSQEEMMGFYYLRGLSGTEQGYDQQFPQSKNIEFDEYDQNAVVFLYKVHAITKGVARVIMNSDRKLPSEKTCTLEKSQGRVEVSRLYVAPQFRGLGISNKIFLGICDFALSRGISTLLFGCLEDHLARYHKFGKITVLYRGPYGKIDEECAVAELLINNTFSRQIHERRIR